MEQLQKIMIGNGLLVILIAMLAGFMLMFQLIGGLEYWPGHILPLHIYGTTDGWDASVDYRKATPNDNSHIFYKAFVAVSV